MEESLKDAQNPEEAKNTESADQVAKTSDNEMQTIEQVIIKADLDD